MDQDRSGAGPQLGDAEERTTEQVREEIEQTRSELGDTVAALSQKTNVKAQAQQAVDGAKDTVATKVSDITGSVTGQKDRLISSAQDAAPESASDAGRRLRTIATDNRPVLIAVAALGLGMVIGRRSGR